MSTEENALTAPRDVLRLTAEDVGYIEYSGMHAGPRAVIGINGRDLREYVREVELPFASAEGAPELAGDYLGLPLPEVLLPSRYLLGEPAENWWPALGGKVPVLGCTCGLVDCSPLMALITVTTDAVTWSDFEHPLRSAPSKRHWRYDGLGPFVFDRAQYEAALTGPQGAVG